MLECEVKRYSAYFRGWCQAFGEHESIQGEQSGISLLFADNQVGLVLPKPLIKPLYREVLLHEHAPPLKFGNKGLQVGSLEVELASEQEKKGLATIRKFFAAGNQFHLFLTSHLLYQSGSRIITFSNRKPLLIIYKEIGTMQIRFAPEG
jgi:hypothetical protein